MATPESKVKKQVKSLLSLHECYHFWPVQTGYGAATLDCLASHKGDFFAIETKAPGKKLTPRQLIHKRDIERSGAPVFVIGEHVQDGVYTGMDNLAAWLQR